MIIDNLSTYYQLYTRSTLQTTETSCDYNIHESLTDKALIAGVIGKLSFTDNLSTYYHL